MERYHIPKGRTQSLEDRILRAGGDELEKWANDPSCFEMHLCAQEIRDRQARREARGVAVATGPAPATEHQEDAPFNPQPEVSGDAERIARGIVRLPFDQRTEVSADAEYIARRIVKHLWIIFVLLPLVGALLWLVVAASTR